MSTSTAVHGASKKKVTLHLVMDIPRCVQEQVAGHSSTHVYAEAKVCVCLVVV